MTYIILSVICYFIGFYNLVKFGIIIKLDYTFIFSRKETAKIAVSFYLIWFFNNLWSILGKNFFPVWLLTWRRCIFFF